VGKAPFSEERNAEIVFIWGRGIRRVDPLGERDDPRCLIGGSVKIQKEQGTAHEKRTD